MRRTFVLPQLTIQILEDEGLIEYRYKGGKKIYIGFPEWEQMARDSIQMINYIRSKQQNDI